MLVPVRVVRVHVCKQPVCGCVMNETCDTVAGPNVSDAFEWNQTVSENSHVHAHTCAHTHMYTRTHTRTHTGKHYRFTSGFFILQPNKKKKPAHVRTRMPACDSRAQL